MIKAKWWIWTAIFACIGIFIKVFSELKEVASGETQLLHFDMQILNSFVTLRTPIFNEIAVNITSLGSTFIVTAAILFLVILFSLRKYWFDVGHIVMAGLMAAILSPFFKNLGQRERPPLSFHLVQVDHYSYPSGHALTSAIVYITLGFIFLERYRSRKEKYFCLASSILLVVAIGLSRIYLGVHYPSDVLGGFCLGLAAALGLYLARKKFDRNY